MNNTLISFFRRHRLFSIAAVVLFLAAGSLLAWKLLQPQPTTGGQTIPIQGGGITQTGAVSSSGGAILPVSIRLSEGKAQPQAVQPVQRATGEPLSAEQIRLILTRLPALPVDPETQVDFKLPKDPIPPPRPGQTIQQPFPPSQAAAIPELPVSGALEVLRYSPEGEIPIAPFINITFNQPMIALGTIADLAAQAVPVQIEPPLSGTWRWLGTKTLNFQYDSALIDRLPKATSYRVTIPAGTKSATGGVLSKAVEWAFSTPPAKIVRSFPLNEPQTLTPLFFIEFDQRIDPAAVLNTVRVTAGGTTPSLELVSENTLKADEKQNWLLKDAKAGRWLAFKAKEPLPADATISVAVGPNTPSAEGPLVTKEAQSFGFHTYAALRIEDHGCSYGSDLCTPLSPFFIRFNNPIDEGTYRDSMLKIEPDMPGAMVNIYGTTINIQGQSKGQTKYTVTVSGEIQDTFGQKLGQDAQLTFRVGQAEPMLSGPSGNFVTLDPAAKKPVFTVYTINMKELDVKIYAVQPSDWLNFKPYDFDRSGKPISVPGRLALDKTLPVESAADALTEVDIDLSQVMDGSFGQFIVTVSPPKSLLQSDPNRSWRSLVVWVQVTQIGLDAFSDHSEMVVWATALKDGAPLSGVTITAGAGGGLLATTAADGTARFGLPTVEYLVAKQGADLAILPHDPYPWSGQGWVRTSPVDELRWYVFDDRQMYRPGEEVHFKGWMRRIGAGQNGDVGLVGSSVTAVNYQIIESQGNVLGNGRVEVNALGGFDFVFKLPETVNLGYTQLVLSAEGGLGGMQGQQFNHSFQIQEFRRPEFEVLARNESSGPYFVGGQAVLAVDANYYAGGALPNADVTWQVTSTPGHYAPPNWTEFMFGTWTPWWIRPVFSASGKMGYQDGQGSRVETFTGKTDAGGTHYLQLNIDSLGGIQPVSVMAQGTVMDVNRQAWTGSTTLLVHPADLYVGLRSDRMFVDKGVPIQVDYIVTDLDGKPVADRPVELKAARLEWKIQGGTWQEVEADVQTCSQGSQAAPATCAFNTPIGGTYRITATVRDAQGRQNQSQILRWVSGGKLPPARQVEQEQVTLIPDRQSYQPGDVAKILVQAPFSPAEGLLTVSRNGILYTERFKIEDSTITLSIPIEDKYIPNLNIQVDLNGAAPRTGDQGEALAGVAPRPAYASGQLNLEIPASQRTLALLVTPAEPELEPGGETTLSIGLKDAAGKPVSGAEVTVVVVDEAVLALSNYQSPDPLSTFYTNRPAELFSVYERASIVLANPLALGQTTQGGLPMATQVASAKGMERNLVEGAMIAPQAAPSAVGGMADSGQAASQPIRVRVDFNPLATFRSAEKTNANGEVQIQVKLPDNLTRYRVMVVAVDSGGKQFGQAETNLVARLPLMVRPSAPRFLNFGDQFELPVVLQNQTGQAMVVDVAVQGSNIILTGSQGMRVTVPARDRVEVRFPATTQMAGMARLQIAAVSGQAADAATVELPVYTPATSEAFATYGVIDSGATAQPVGAPSGVFPQYGGLEITTSSTALQGLTDAVLYLVAYPYECSEQLSSRILAVAALRDVLTAFNASGLPSKAEMEAAVTRDITRLQGMQNDDGGFPYWQKGRETIPFNTIHAAHALYRAGAKGFAVPVDLQERTLTYLRNIESHYPAWYGQHTRQTLSAYAVYVRNLFGDRDPQKALKLISDAGGLDGLGLETIGWLWPVLKDAPGAAAQLDAIRKYVNNHTVETAGAANFTTGYDEQSYLLLSSDRRTDAILLDALILDNPKSDLIVKLVNGLLANRTRGRWGNTQDNVFVLLALDRYFNTFENQTPEFVAQIWLGNTYAGSQQFSGRSTDRQQTNIPMTYLVDPALGGGVTQNLVLSKDGAGRLYYRLGLRYAPTDLNLKSLDMGFVVQRSYEGLDDPTDVTRTADGIWHIKAGARVRVKLTMVADNRRYHVALADPLPAGLEIVNPGLAVSGSVPQDPGSPGYRYGWWWWGTWYEHQNLRDERAEAFTSLLWEGVYQYSYTARATTPGKFIVPPAKAEEMYSPEVFGRSASDIVIVE
jgi:uncharacterized protein YfaS (alpha-2-macroglobulin family)